MSWRLADGVRWLPVDDGAIVFNPANASFADLNAPAAPVFAALLEADWSADEAARLLVDGHGVDPEAAPRLVADLLDGLRRSGMLAQDEAGGPD
ncbi:MAG: hypothetical protein H0W25_13530 [Acidimicrobiia bacterium]|nr:hypothetical protein [Acidimicrobiia bacterium]